MLHQSKWIDYDITLLSSANRLVFFFSPKWLPTGRMKVLQLVSNRPRIGPQDPRL